MKYHPPKPYRLQDIGKIKLETEMYFIKTALSKYLPEDNVNVRYDTSHNHTGIMGFVISFGGEQQEYFIHPLYGVSKINRLGLSRIRDSENMIVNIDSLIEHRLKDNESHKKLLK